jgi:hypothetical protein
MGIHVVIQPLAGYDAEIVSPSPGVRELVVGGEEAAILVQVPLVSAVCRTRRDSRGVWLRQRANSASGATRKTVPVRTCLRRMSNGPTLVSIPLRAEMKLAARRWTEYKSTAP